MNWRARAALGATLGIALLVGYGIADAYDVVPGVLTLAPPYAPPAPFPEPPGAVAAPELSVLLADLPAEAPAPSVDQVQALVDRAVEDPRLGPRVGILVVDALTGAQLGAHRSNDMFTPASTQKILTAIAALTELNHEATLDTVVVQDGARVTIIGGGDMMIAAGEGTADSVPNHASLADLAAQAAARIALTGRDAVNLEIDTTLFPGPAVAEAVPPGEVNAGFIGPVAAMAIDQGRVVDQEIAPRYPDPAMHLAETFAEQLAEHGIAVLGPITRATAPAAGQEIARIHSAPLVDVVEWAMQRSDNTITEVLGRLVAVQLGLPGTGAAALQAVQEVVARAGVDLSGAHLVDLSGLGRGSVLSPRMLVDAMTVATDPGHPLLREVAVGLPIGNLSGTLFDRFTDENPARGLVRAKTGSLPGVAALCGTVVSGERLLYFAIVADEVPEDGPWGARQAIDEFVGNLAALGRDGAPGAPAEQLEGT